MKLTEEARNAINTIRPSLVATASKTGKPNVSAKGSLSILDDEHLTFLDVNSPRTVKNIRENPQIAIICLDQATRKGIRVWGKGEIISSGELFDRVLAAQANKNRSRKVNNAVIVTVEEVEIFAL